MSICRRRRCACGPASASPAGPRRTAPALYLAVRRITRQDDGGLSFDGPGELVDAVVEMRRFADCALLETVAARDCCPRRWRTAWRA